MLCWMWGLNDYLIYFIFLDMMLIWGFGIDNVCYFVIVFMSYNCKMVVLLERDDGF